MNKPMGERLILRANGSVDTPGIDYETSKMSVVAKTEDAIVIKVPSRTCWNGNYCPRLYRSPMLMVFQVKKSTMKNGDEYLDVEPLIEWDCGRAKGSVTQ